MKIKMKYFLSLMMTLFVQIIIAQEINVSGKVIDEKGTTIPGANVVIKGTSIGTQTGFDGGFSIKAKEGVLLVISFLGMREVELPATKSMNVKLIDISSQLETVVVIGYGTQSKKKLTDNIARVTAKDIEQIPVANIQNALVGKLAGVQITQTNGKVEGGINIRVRGAASISAGTNPLYVIDGMPLINQNESNNGAPLNPLLTLSANEIESIEVLKDASAAAIYGSRGANGIIIINTKKGKNGKATFSANFSQGVSEETNRKEFLNAAQYVELFKEARLNSGFSDPTLPGRKFDQLAAGQDWRNGAVDTDWQDLIFRNGYNRDADVSVSGGNEKTNYFFSLAHNDTKGIIVGNDLEKFSVRNNLSHKISDKFTAGVNLSFSRNRIDRIANDNAFVTPLQAIAQSPLSPARFVDGTPNNKTQYVNFLFAQENSFYKTLIRRLIGKAFGEYKFTNSLKFNSEVGYDLYSQTEDYWQGALTPFMATNGEVFASSANNESYILTNYFTYNKEFADKHSVNLVGGMEFNKFNSRYQSTTSIWFPSDDLQTIDSGAEVSAGEGNESNYTFVSQFGRLTYNFGNKYLFKAAIRRDASSRFGRNSRVGYFPAVSAGWIISEENFLKDNKVLSYFKLKTSWGKVGNAEIGNFKSRSLFNGASYNLKSGLALSQPGNDDLGWEKSTQTDFGVEIGFFNHLNIEFDYYKKQTNGLLFDVPLPISSGALTIAKNIGLIEGKGIEFVINSKNINTENFKWNTNLNITTNETIVKELPNNNSDVNSTEFTINRVNENLNSFYLVQYAGVDPLNGNALFVKNTLNPNGTIDKSTTSDYSLAKRVVSGNPFPTLMAGLTNTISYKNMDLSFTLQGEWGASIYNSAGIYQSANGDFWDNQTVDQMNRWQKIGDITNVPQARYVGGNGTQASTRYLENSDFIRLRNLTIGYSLPRSVLKTVGMSSVRIYLTSVNLLTFTKYNGYDPEARADQGNRIGEEFYSAPPAKTMAMGVNVNF